MMLIITMIKKKSFLRRRLPKRDCHRRIQWKSRHLGSQRNHGPETLAGILGCIVTLWLSLAHSFATSLILPLPLSLDSSLCVCLCACLCIDPEISINISIPSPISIDISPWMSWIHAILLQILEDHTRSANCVRFHGSNQLLLSGSQDGTAKIWDLRSLSENKYASQVFKTKDSVRQVGACFIFWCLTEIFEWFR